MHARFGRGCPETYRREPARRRAPTLRNQKIIAAAIAVDADEAAGQVSAVEGRAELALHETRKRDAAGALAGQEGLQMVAEEPVKYGPLRVPPMVAAALRTRPSTESGRTSGDRIDHRRPLA